ncbi:predicted dehydrogenase [Chthonomonas calidirosea]|uniref:Predicted dehydrogenases and related proteins n=1 Tax=Chthonomonas calidirosea (strain DSM 23976 / ICMP 18418 / T49) TaxID=1303518 RepID=S0EW17_CHTCT|nr:Gfo/Idh/MocA family oxidoreductase [Chthonomonas calidirosea]CCW36015.1 Predicted dehydrogenases and related proteins [Chthonomonas calidirosea T49]CEK18579.1 predicted dehydrogenase [Chthonomonas calidirosea]
MEPLRIGVIGCEIARMRYHTALVATPQLRVTAVTDPDPRLARIWARQIGGRPTVCADTLDLLDQPLDAVLVTTPLALRAQAIADALRADLPVLAEVPFALHLADMDDLLVLASRSDRLLMPALPRRFDPSFRKLHQIVQENALGTPEQLRCTWGLPQETDLPSGDGVSGGWNAHWQYLACQSLDLCFWWQGEGFAVSADMEMAQLMGAPCPKGKKAQADALAILLVTHPHGRSIHQFMRTLSVRPEERYFLTGSHGNAELIAGVGASTATNLPLPYLTLQRVGEHASRVNVDLAPEEQALSPSAVRIRRLLQHFAACVRQQEEPEIGPHTARVVLDAVHAAYVSACEQNKVSLPLRRFPDIAALLHRFHGVRRALPKGLG